MESSVEEIADGVFRLPQAGGERRLSHNGEMLYRFMDCFYIRKEHLHELTPEEVSNLCRARSQFPGLITRVNDDVQVIFRKLIPQLNPSRLLEIGSGRRPIFSSAPEGFHYVMSDADSSVMSGSSEGVAFCEFSGTKPELPYDSRFFDIVIAVFVLQFPFHEAQIAELYRCITEDGIFLANVYRRPPQACEELYNQFKSEGFQVFRIEDPQSLCRNHEYWLISKCQDRINKTIPLLRECLNASPSATHS